MNERHKRAGLAGLGVVGVLCAVFLGGQPVADIDGYAPAVAPRAHSLGERTLAAGKHQLVVTVFAKTAASKGHFVGLDRIELRP